MDEVRHQRFRGEVRQATPRATKSELDAAVSELVAAGYTLAAARYMVAQAGGGRPAYVGTRKVRA